MTALTVEEKLDALIAAVGSLTAAVNTAISNPPTAPGNNADVLAAIATVNTIVTDIQSNLGSEVTAPAAPVTPPTS